MKKALLSFSKYQFDPIIEKFSTGSVGVMAKSLYETLRKSGFEVDYIDPSESNTFSVKDYDIFVGQPDQWINTYKRAEAKINVLFMVTTHPARRNELMKKAAKKWKVLDEELLSCNETRQALKKADYVFQIGNEFAVKSLIENGVPKEKIIHIHYGINHLKINNEPKERDLDNFLHLASGLGLRKGLPETLEMYEKYLKQKNLTVIGGIYKHEPNYKYWKKQINDNLIKYKKIQYLGFINSDSKKYDEILEKQSWLLYPSIEEGEPGTVIEAMTKGVVPLIYRSGSNIDFSITENYESIEKQIKQALKTTPKEWVKLSQKAQHYIRVINNHEDWENRLIEIWNKIMEKPDFNRPLVSIIIPFFNKEKIIKSLLESLLENTVSYKNFELHIIYDGCKDKTKENAQYILKKFSVPVFEYETPNIFEVKTNNLGFKNSNGKYCVIVQDDNFINEKKWLEKIIYFMEEVPRAAVVGGLAGVNFFPLTANPTGLGVMKEPREVYQRIDIKLNPELNNKIIEVDAVMRGPLIFRKELLERYGYLDEAYCPLHNDDMDYCFRMKKLGYSIFYYPIDVENKALTVSSHNPEKRKFWEDAVREHLKLFYDRWEEYTGKHDDYLTLPKPNYLSDKSFKRIFLLKLNIKINSLKEIISIKKISKFFLIETPLPIKLFLVKKLKKLSLIFTKLADKIQIYGIEPRTIPWHIAKGDETLRMNYNLNENSIVFVIGKIEDHWSEKIFCKYSPNIYIFTEKYNELKDIFSENSKIKMDDLKCKFLEDNNNLLIDLVKIDAEGKEYEILENLIASNQTKNILNIQIKFNEFIPNAYERMTKIHEKLKTTHKLTYYYEFVWENWKLKENE